MKNTTEIFNNVMLLRNSGKSWNEVAVYFNKETKQKVTGEQLRKRYSRWYASNAEPADAEEYVEDLSAPAYDTDFQPEDGKEYVDADFNRIKLFKKAYFDHDVKKTPEVILQALGYDPKLFKLGKYTLSNWDVPSKSVNKDCFAIKAVILPKNEADLTAKDYVALAKEAFSGKIGKCEKLKKASHVRDGANIGRPARLLEIPPIELHYGRIANDIASHTSYDLDIAEEYFYKIVNSIIDLQTTTNADECLLVIGSDFFNSESTTTTTKGTPQQNAADFRKMFMGGLDMYKYFIEQLAKVFPVVNVMLCAGNHARAMEFFLYCALKEYFSDNQDIIHFKEDYTPTQAFTFGNVGLFYNHGDVNQKRTIASIPAEFPKEWGSTLYRELHMGHLHCEKVVDENAGLITRRIGSPCESDSWSYLERFVGAVKKHQVFTWDSCNGLVSINYINV